MSRLESFCFNVINLELHIQILIMFEWCVEVWKSSF
jgi:hypothetical protein